MVAIAASSHLASFVAWQFLPPFLSSLLLKVFYSLFPRRRPTVPPNPPPAQLAYENARATRHAQRARIVLVSGYLLYTLVSAYLAQGSGFNQNYYSLLGIDRALVEAEGERAVKSHWRKLARIYHPDKVGKQGEEVFVRLRRGVDALENEGKRWAYERWGPEVADWGKLSTQREYISRGVQQTAVFWAFAAGSIFLLGFFRKEERSNKFWRYFMLLLALSTELHLTFHGHSSLLSALFPARLAYEHISLVRDSFLSFSMAVSQLAPLLFPSTAQEEEDNSKDPMVRAQREAASLRVPMSRLAHLVREAEREVVGLQHLEMRPLLEGAEKEGEQKKVVEELKRRMERTYHDINIKQNPATSALWAQAVLGEGRVKVEKKEQEEETLVRIKKEEGVSLDELSAEAASRLPTPPPE